MFLADKEKISELVHLGLKENFSIFEIGGLYSYIHKKDSLFCYIGLVKTTCSCPECDYDVTKHLNKSAYNAWFFSSKTGEYFYFPASAKQINEDADASYKLMKYFKKVL